MKKIKIEQNFDILPYEHVNGMVNEYALFMKEFNNSNKYRLIFSFNPICSNILFNTITEVVQNEGSENCILFNKNEKLTITDEKLSDYLEYTKRITSGTTTALTKEELINDTGYSHPEIGDFQYHCGYDIFDNHILRSKDFVVVNKMTKNTDDSTRVYFNTLQDYVRDNLGVIKNDMDLKDVSGKTTISRHIYTTDTVYSFNTSINENLTEVDGWLGFINKGNLRIPNYEGHDNIIINRVINNKELGAFIDMYPDRSLYSIIPKYNKFRNRHENNWEFCLTYPFENEYNNDLITKHGYNGIECFFKLEGTLQIGTAPDSKIITLRTFVEHGMVVGDKFKLAYFWEDENGNLKSSGETTNECNVIDTGSNIYEKKQYIKICVGNIANLMSEIYKKVEGKDEDIFAFDRDYFSKNNIKFRFARVVGGQKSKYYIRKFKKLKKLDGSDYTYTLNKLAFAKNIYNDRIGEIIFDDIIDVSNIRNNLGLPLNEIFISVFKTNYGHEQWYNTEKNKINTTADTIEFSHCFGKLSSGFEMPSDEECSDYNIHRIHNINKSNKGIPNSGKALEGDISLRKNIDEFYGDLVEFSESSLSENILEDVYYRFNTAQREIDSSIFSALTYNEIVHDDYDVYGNSTKFLEKKNIALDDEGNVDRQTAINLNPEGYYYKAHYKITLKEYLPRIYWGSDTLMNFDVNQIEVISGITDEGNIFYEYKIECDKNYYMTTYDKLYLINKTDNSDIVYGYIIKSIGKRCHITFPDVSYEILLSDYKMFKVNPIKPEYAYTLSNGTGKYIWRNFKEHKDIDNTSELYNRPFTNGTHYLHENINLYLKRQDPLGYFGLSFNSQMPFFKTNFIVLGNEKDVNNKDYVKNIEQRQC